MSQRKHLELLPPHLRKKSISEREIVLPMDEALEAIDLMESGAVRILGWEGWVKDVQGRVGHGSAGYLGADTGNLSPGEAAAVCRETILLGASDWSQKNKGSTDALHFCITVRGLTGSDTWGKS